MPHFLVQGIQELKTNHSPAQSCQVVHMLQKLDPLCRAKTSDVKKNGKKNPVMIIDYQKLL